ncbi:MAG: GNAT family N-acetyltransferase [Ruminococcus flavefaciens]|nr:GNAT family N-acetyltransferase [Ruminococcus flavefaciens]MCM1361267.1 GNAT family N-acetyltransferase [Clostridiales bacterium]MCM1435379.1 GNAT family N-acetyltransferase [Ruminococcus flavefaciens]
MSGIYQIRRFRVEDAGEVSELIAKTLRTVNIKDYSEEYIEANVSSHSADVLIERAKHGHMYVVYDDSQIVGCGAIAGYWGSTTESILLTIFVLPEYQGKKIGTLIIRTLEKDEFFLRAKRIEIPASITAVDFYKKMGYDYKNGIAEIDDEQLYRLEKFR